MELPCIAKNCFVFLQPCQRDICEQVDTVTPLLADNSLAQLHDFCSNLLSHEWPPQAEDRCHSPVHGLLSDPKLCQDIQVLLRCLVIERPPLSLHFPSHVFKSVQLRVRLEQLSRSMLKPGTVFHGPQVVSERVPCSTLKPDTIFRGPQVVLERVPHSTLKPSAIFCGPQLKVKLKALSLPSVKPQRRVFKKKYKCATCDEQHDSHAAVKDHCRYTHGMFLCRSSFCQAMFVSEGACHAHEQIHLKSERSCKTCGQQFQHCFALARHSVIHQKKAAFPCHRYSTKYKRKQDLLEHFRTKHKSSEFKCSKCDFTWPSARQVRQHEYGHMPNSLVCDRCGHTSTYPLQMSAHRKHCA